MIVCEICCTLPGESRQTGLSLVELMISMTLGMLVVLAGGALLVSTKSGYSAQNEVALVEDAGRYALENISRSVRQAAFENLGTEDTPIVTQAEYSANITGFDARSLKGTSGGIDALLIKAVNGSDVLAIRFFGSGLRPNGDGTMVNCAGFSVPAPDSQAEAEEDRGWSIYYVAEDSTGEPELYCKYRGDSGWTSQAIARGVESFQVLYGVDTDGDGVMNRLCTATEIDALDDKLSLAGANAIERSRDRVRKTYWKKVVLVKIGLLIHGARKVRSDAQNLRYDLFGTDYAADHAHIDIGTSIEEAKLGKGVKNRIRRIFSSTVQLRNLASGSAI